MPPRSLHSVQTARRDDRAPDRVLRNRGNRAPRPLQTSPVFFSPRDPHIFRCARFAIERRKESCFQDFFGIVINYVWMKRRWFLGWFFFFFERIVFRDFYRA